VFCAWTWSGLVVEFALFLQIVSTNKDFAPTVLHTLQFISART
jgi:hypothetical protein